MFPDQPWWARIIELLVITGCSIGVLMFLAANPDFDEIYKGVGTGVVAFFVSQFSTRLNQNQKKDE